MPPPRLALMRGLAVAAIAAAARASTLPPLSCPADDQCAGPISGTCTLPSALVAAATGGGGRGSTSARGLQFGGGGGGCDADWCVSLAVCFNQMRML